MNLTSNEILEHVPDFWIRYRDDILVAVLIDSNNNGLNRLLLHKALSDYGKPQVQIVEVLYEEPLSLEYLFITDFRVGELPVEANHHLEDVRSIIFNEDGSFDMSEMSGISISTGGTAINPGKPVPRK